MPSEPSITSVIGLPPEDTVRAFEARDELRITNRWSEMWHGDHARAFTVARVAKLDLLATIRDSLHRVIGQGGTFEEWKANIVPELRKAGWWGTVTDRTLTGADHDIYVGPRRLRTIYDTNLRMSRAAGRWARIQALKGSRPYLRYTAVMDERTRAQHRLWHGTIQPVDSEWWDTHYPPCGWFCRCTVRQLSERDLARNGWRVTAKPPEGAPRRFYRAGSDTPEIVPAGIAPGFAYNPGKASMAAVAEKATRSLEDTAAADLGAARFTLNELVASDAFLETLSEPGATFPVMVLDDATRDAIGATAHVATLSSATYTKQRARHPELGLTEYRKLPQLGADADIVAVESDAVLKFARMEDGRWLVAVVKRTSSGAAMFVTSYRIQAASSLKRLLEGARIIYDRR